MTPQYFQGLMDNVANFFGTTSGIYENLIQTAIVIFVLLLVRYLLLLFIFLKIKEPERHYNFKRYSAHITFVIGVFLVGKVWFEGFQSLATFLGLLSVGLALALRELLTDLAGWLFIIIRKPFELGDRIEVFGVKGDVIDKRLFTFSVIEIGNRVDAEQSTGRVIHIPNSKVFTEYVANYTSGFNYIWHEIPVHITFESNHEKAVTILLEIVNSCAGQFAKLAEKELKQAKESFMLKYSVLTPTVYTNVRANGIRLTIRYMCHVRKTRSTEENIWLKVLKAFKKEGDITFAYQTVRVVEQPNEAPKKDTD